MTNYRTTKSNEGCYFWNSQPLGLVTFGILNLWGSLLSGGGGLLLSVYHELKLYKVGATEFFSETKERNS